MNGFMKKLLATILCGALTLTVPLPAIAQDAETSKEPSVEVFEGPEEEQPSEMALAEQDLREQEVQAGDEPADDSTAEPIAMAEADSDITPTPGWELFGTCEWQIDSERCLTLRPAQNSEYGNLPSMEEEAAPPWADQGYRGYVSSGTVDIEKVVIAKKIIAANTLGGFFWGLQKLEDIEGLENLDTRAAESMEGMFGFCRSLRGINTSSFNTSNVTSMRAMFYMCDSLVELDLTNFDTSKVTDMGWMFGGGKLASDISDVPCDSHEDLPEFHNHYEGLKVRELNLSNFDTSSVTSMSGMFASCTELVELNLDSFETTNVKYMGSMFSGCASLAVVPIEKFDTSSVINMGGMFEGCESIKEFNLSHFDTNAVMSMWGHVFLLFLDRVVGFVLVSYSKTAGNWTSGGASGI